MNELLAQVFDCDTTISDHTKARAREGEKMKKLLVFFFFAAVGLLFLNFNEARQLRNAIQESVVSAEHSITETVTLTEGEEYKVDAIEITVQAGSEFALQYLGRCGKYFYTIQYRNRAYIGFRFPLPDATMDTRQVQGNFLRGKYRVIVVDYDYSSPTVEFDGDEIIVRMNKMDLREASCFRGHTVI